MARGRLQHGEVRVLYSTQGSNNYYLKLQVSNTALIVKGVQLKLGSSYAQLTRTSDNYWQLSSASPIAIPVSVKITSVTGEVVEDTWSPASISGPPVQGKGQFTVSADMEIVGGGNPIQICPLRLQPHHNHPRLPHPLLPPSVESGNLFRAGRAVTAMRWYGGFLSAARGCQDAPSAGAVLQQGVPLLGDQTSVLLLRQESLGGRPSRLLI